MWPFRREPEPFLDDLVFGRITYEGGYWSSTPSDWKTGFAISIEAGLAGPSDVQRAFFTQLRPMIADLHHRAAVYANASEECNDLHGNPVDLNDLGVYQLNIGTDAECKEGAFEMEFCDDDAELIHEVWFKEFQPISFGQSD